MSKTYLPYEPDQQFASGVAGVAADEHLAYFISDVVDQLDMWVTAATSGNGVAGRYHPRMMVNLSTSSRRIAQRLHRHRLQGVGGEQHTDFRTISDFRKDNLDALSGL